MAVKTKSAGDRPFERVWAIVLRVPRGKVVAYGLVSQMIDRRLTPVGARKTKAAGIRNGSRARGAPPRESR